MNGPQPQEGRTPLGEAGNRQPDTPAGELPSSALKELGRLAQTPRSAVRKGLGLPQVSWPLSCS